MKAALFISPDSGYQADLVAWWLSADHLMKLPGEFPNEVD